MAKLAVFHCGEPGTAAGCVDKHPGLQRCLGQAGLQQEFVSVHSPEDTLQTARFFMKELLAAAELQWMLKDPVGRHMSFWQKRATRQRRPRGAPCSRDSAHSLGRSMRTLVWGFHTDFTSYRSIFKRSTQMV